MYERTCSKGLDGESQTRFTDEAVTSDTVNPVGGNGAADGVHGGRSGSRAKDMNKITEGMLLEKMLVSIVSVRA